MATPTGPAPAPSSSNTPAVPPSAPGVAAAPGMGYAAPRPPSRRIWIVIGAILVAVVIVLAVFFLFLLPRPAHPTGPMTYQTAASEANQYLSGYRGGGWRIAAAFGAASPSPLSLPLGPLPLSNLTGTSCSVLPLYTNGTTISVPGYVSEVGSGKATGWVFVALNATGAVILLNNAGTISPLVQVQCPPYLATDLALVPSLASGLVDSSVAASAAASAGAGPFLLQYPNASAGYEIAPAGLTGTPFGNPEWQVIYQACGPATGAAPNGTSAVVPTFNATVNALTGRVVAFNATPRACSVSAASVGLPPSLGPGPIAPPTSSGSQPLSLTLGPNPSAHAGTEYWYNFTVYAVTGTPTWNNTQFEILDPNGVPVSLAAPATFSVFDNGLLVAQAGTPAGTASGSNWTQGAGNAIFTGESLSIAIAQNFTGSYHSLEVIGTGPYFGAVVVPFAG